MTARKELRAVSKPEIPSCTAGSLRADPGARDIPAPEAPVIVKVPRPPGWPVSQLASFELRNYRHDLEQALAGDPEDPADRQLMQARLAQVVSEQQARARTAGIPAGSGSTGMTRDHLELA